MAIDKGRVLAAAQKHLARNSIDKAIEELSRIVREDPRDLRVRQKIAELLARQGRVPEAMREFLVVAEAYVRDGFFPKAAAIYKQMLQFEPNNVQWHMALGEIYQQLALLSDAMDHFNRVARHVETSGTSREKIDIYERLLRLNPDSVEYADKLAEQLRTDGDTQAAFDVWRKTAEMLEQRQDLESLVRVYERMSSLRPEDLGLVRALADLYLERRDPRRALSKLQICFKADPQDTETLNLLADAFVDLGEADKAVAVLRELAQIYDTLGYEEYRNQVMDRIAELDPSSGSVVAGSSALGLPGGDELVEGLTLPSEPPQEAVQRVATEAEVFLQYGLVDRAQAAVEKALVTGSDSFALRRLAVRLAVAAEDVDAAREHLDAMYERAVGVLDLRTARECLLRACRLEPDSEAARARLAAFDAQAAELTDDDPAHVESDDDDFGSAIELSSRLAGRDDADDGGEIDDDELHRLASQLASQLDDPDEEPTAHELDLGFDAEQPTAYSADDPSAEDAAGDDDPFAALDSAGGGLAEFGLDDLDLSSLEGPRESAFELGRRYFESAMYEDAAVELRRAADEGDQAGAALELLGLALRRLRDFRGAVEAFREALRSGDFVEPQAVLGLMFELGATYEAAGNGAGALKIYEKILERDRGHRDGDVARRVQSLAARVGR